MNHMTITELKYAKIRKSYIDSDKIELVFDDNTRMSVVFRKSPIYTITEGAILFEKDDFNTIRLIGHNEYLRQVFDSHAGYWKPLYDEFIENKKNSSK